MATSSTLAPSAFTITQAGLNAAMMAQGLGLAISITAFKLGTTSGYTPSLADTAIHGAPVYAAAPSSWTLLSDTTRDIVCVVPATAGPFTYGEIGLYLEDGTLFALAAFNTPQTKASSASGVANALTFHCVLNIGMSPSVLQIITGTPGVITVMGNTSNVTGKRYMPGQPDALIVREAVNGNNSLFMTAANDLQWNVAGYLQVDSGVLTAVSGNGVTLTSTAFNLADSVFLPGDFLMQDMQGNVRVISSGTPGVVNLTYPVGGLASGATVMLLARETTLSDYIYLETVIEEKDSAQTQALNSAITQLHGYVVDQVTTLNNTVTAAIAADAAALAAASAANTAALSAMQAQVSTTINNITGVPPGGIIFLPSTAIPVGYLELNGQMLYVPRYPDLFNFYGYSQGGSGNFFFLPDYRGYKVRASDNGRGIWPGSWPGVVQGSAAGSGDYTVSLTACTACGHIDSSQNGNIQNLNIVIAADTQNLDVLAAATANGFNGTSATNITLTINGGVVVSGSPVGVTGTAPAMTVQGYFGPASTLTIVNNGYIIGMGGRGGDPSRNNVYGGNGYPGGDALSLFGLSPAPVIKISNNGIIGGGGGGGGGGGNSDYGGGGGRSGRINSGGTSNYAGTFAGGGGGILPSGMGNSGPGGNWGASGGEGSWWPGDWTWSNGGAGGVAVRGAGYISQWLATGTRYGSVI